MLISCRDCIHDGVCFLQEVTNDTEEQLREFGCENYKCATDFVKIIRCKDCKYYDIKNEMCLLHSELADKYSSGFNFEMYSNDFCSYAEERSEEK